jgi:hypothetical protein
VAGPGLDAGSYSTQRNDLICRPLWNEPLFLAQQLGRCSPAELVIEFTMTGRPATNDRNGL